MKTTTLRPAMAAAALAALSFVANSAWALNANQTLGFGKGKLKTFTYAQNFHCVDQPGDDLNFNGVFMESDPLELQTPICRPGVQTTIDPSGTALLDKNAALKKSANLLFVLVPMFSVNLDTTNTDALPCPSTLPSFAPNGVTPVSEVCGTGLGDFLIATFGSIPDAFRIQSALDPGITTQCPTASDPEGSCTTHGDTIDLGAALGFPANNVITPIPNHTHVIDVDVSKKKSQWWEIIDVAVNDPAVWPSASDPSAGLTSLKAIRAAQSTPSTVVGAPPGTMQANPDVPTNFFLFFGVQNNTGGAAAAMHGMPGM